MSKAFTKETEGDEEDDLPDDAPALPLGTKNYMTEAGFEALRRRTLGALMRGLRA